MQRQQKNTGLIWFRNNLRVNDNISLKKSIENNSNTIAVYFFDPKLFKVFIEDVSTMAPIGHTIINK